MGNADRGRQSAGERIPSLPILHPLDAFDAEAETDTGGGPAKPSFWIRPCAVSNDLEQPLTKPRQFLHFASFFITLTGGDTYIKFVR